MANEGKKDFNKQMNNKKDMPKIVTLDEGQAKKWGGETMVIAPPTDYDELMKKVPLGKLTTTDQLRKTVAKKYGVAVTCPLTCGIFVNICAWASEQRENDKTAYWRTLKSDGQLNEKYPGGTDGQKDKLEQEGFSIVAKGRKNVKYYVSDYEDYLIDLEEE